MVITVPPAATGLEAPVARDIFLAARKKSDKSAIASSESLRIADSVRISLAIN
jgi:hypothetical protein